MEILIGLAIAITAFVTLVNIYEYKSQGSTNTLRDLLASGKWREANKETERLLELTTNRAMGLPSKLERSGLGFKEFGCIPCPILRTIDQLWVQYSDGHFGFSIQLGILEECKKADDWKKKEVKEFDRGMCGHVQEHFLKLSGSLVPLADPVEVVMLRERLGWITRCYPTEETYSFMCAVDPSKLKYSIGAPKGHLPVYDNGTKIFNSYMLYVWQRLKDCGI
ncbi:MULTISPECIES: GUN4 domain-containing protein [unclassified Microcoleus]|uniref:GUN4 domain-containing protein n=1 Tax=unclassified Microcoleus TaxID=2642155 RepID=UPI002FD0B6C3